MHLQVCDGHNKTVNRKDKEGQLGVALYDHQIPRSLLIVLTYKTHMPNWTVYCHRESSYRS